LNYILLPSPHKTGLAAGVQIIQEAWPEFPSLCSI
jgi:hypothetical protein